MKKTLITAALLILFLSVPSHAEMVCYSGTDTNNIEYCGFDTMKGENLDKTYLNHQIWVPGIRVEQKKNKVSISYEKVPGASGYEIMTSEEITGKYKENADLKNGKTADIKDIKYSTVSSRMLYVKVRPYKNINGKRTYGAWSSIYADGKDSEAGDNSEYGTLCYSKKDTNALSTKKIKKLSKKKILKMYKNHTIWTSGIKVEDTGDYARVKFSRTRYAAGYEIRYSKRLDKWKLLTPISIYTKNTVKKFKTASSDTTYIQVRPYIKADKRKIYGKWSSVYAYGYTGEADRDDNTVSR